MNVDRVLHTYNTNAVDLGEVPVLPFAEFRETVLAESEAGKRVIAFFDSALLADPAASRP